MREIAEQVISTEVYIMNGEISFPILGEYKTDFVMSYGQEKQNSSTLL
jgi:hypothetical protein